MLAQVYLPADVIPNSKLVPIDKKIVPTGRKTGSALIDPRKELTSITGSDALVLYKENSNFVASYFFIGHDHRVTDTGDDCEPSGL